MINFQDVLIAKSIFASLPTSETTKVLDCFESLAHSWSMQGFNWSMSHSVSGESVTR